MSHTVEIVVFLLILGGVTAMIYSVYQKMVEQDTRMQVEGTLETFESLVASGVDIGEARELALKWNRCSYVEENEFDRMVELKFGVSWEALGYELESDREGIIFDTLIQAVRTHSGNQRRH